MIELFNLSSLFPARGLKLTKDILIGELLFNQQLPLFDYAKAIAF